MIFTPFFFAALYCAPSVIFLPSSISNPATRKSVFPLTAVRSILYFILQQQHVPAMVKYEIARFLGREALIQPGDHKHLSCQAIWLSFWNLFGSMFWGLSVSAQPIRLGFVDDTLPSVCRNGRYE